jgi:serine/threonine protein phosphatase PrpC
MGGHASGEVASRMVCDALADLEPGATLAATAEGVKERLGAVNAHLVRTAAQSLLADVCGCTVVVLLVRGARMIVLWAGDSRVYRWRKGRIQQLTSDHSAPAGRPGRPESSGVTRAVGAEPTLRLDFVEGDVEAGDRFLLCSDGLTRTVPDVEIQQSLEGADLLTTVEGLVAASLAAGAPDNVTVLVAEAWADAPAGT